MGSKQPSRRRGCRISEFFYLGYEALTLENDELSITLLPGKGSDVIRFFFKPLGLDFLWRSEPGLQGVGAVKSSTPASAFLDYYPGGWQEILPNFGDPCIYKGAQLGLHDEVCLLPWNYQVLQDSSDCASVRLEVRCVRTPFRLSKTFTLHRGSGLEINEHLRNESPEEMDCTWGHHPAFGSPFLSKRCRVFVPPCRVMTQKEYVSPNSRIAPKQDCVWPNVSDKDGNILDLSRIPEIGAHSHDMAYLHRFHEGWYVLFNEDRNVGFALSWDPKIFKYLWFWQVYGGWSGYPWYGMSYNIGLEPCTSSPNSLADAVKVGTQLKLGPGEAVETSLHAEVVLKLEDFVNAHADKA